MKSLQLATVVLSIVLCLAAHPAVANTGNTPPNANQPEARSAQNYRDLTPDGRHRVSFCEDLGCLMAIWGSPIINNERRAGFADLILKLCTYLNLKLDPLITKTETAQDADQLCPKYERQILDQLKLVSDLETKCFLLGVDCGVTIVICAIISQKATTDSGDCASVATISSFMASIARDLDFPEPLVEHAEKINKAAKAASCPAGFKIIGSAAAIWYQDTSRELDGIKSDEQEAEHGQG